MRAYQCVARGYVVLYIDAIQVRGSNSSSSTMVD